MPPLKRLNSVCYSIAQHAMSGLACIEPHLSRACKDAGLDSIEINLMDEDPCPERFRAIRPLHCSFAALGGRLQNILASEGFSLNDIKEMKLVFSFPNCLPGDHYRKCESELIHQSGKTFRRSLTQIFYGNYRGGARKPPERRWGGAQGLTADQYSNSPQCSEPFSAQSEAEPDEQHYA